jgi:hypothetical protein
MSDNKDANDSSGVNLVTVGRIATDMRDQGVELVLAGGDLIDGRGQGVEGLHTQYTAWIGAMAPVFNANIPVLAVPGNHEYWGDTEENCIAAWSQDITPILPGTRTDNPEYPGREFSFTHRNALFIGLDQNRFEKGEAPFYYRGNDLAWMTEQTDVPLQVTRPHIFVFGHMPQFMLSWGWSDTYLPNREAFWNILADARVKFYLTGHSHTYARALASTDDGLHTVEQIIAGSAGAGFETGWDGIYYESTRVTPLVWNNTYEGYLVFTIDDNTIIGQWRYYDPAAGRFEVGDEFGYNLPMPIPQQVGIVR